MSDDDARYFEAFMLGAGPFLGSHFGDGPPAGERGAFWWRKHFRAYAARIEALTAERDAAVAAMNAFRRMWQQAEGDLTEGERRATAAIVAFLQREADASVANYADHQCGRMFEAALLDAKCTIERGEHLPAKPLDT
jgi:hypothetical protein